MNVDIAMAIGIEVMLISKLCVCVCAPCLTLSWLTLQLHELCCSLLGSCVHGISQARVLHWVAIPFSRMSIAQTWRSHFNTWHCFYRALAVRSVPCRGGPPLLCRVLLWPLFSSCLFSFWMCMEISWSCMGTSGCHHLLLFLVSLCRDLCGPSVVLSASVEHQWHMVPSVLVLPWLLRIELAGDSGYVFFKFLLSHQSFWNERKKPPTN